MTDTQFILLFFLMGTVIGGFAPPFLYAIGVRDNHGEAAGFSYAMGGMFYFLLACALIGCIGYHAKGITPADVALIGGGMVLLVGALCSWHWPSSWHERRFSLIAFAIGTAAGLLGIFA